MKGYAIIANAQNNCFVIPTKCIFKLNSKNKLQKIDDNDMDLENLYVRSSTYNFDGIKIIDTGDDRIKLRSKHESRRRIVMAKTTSFSPQNSTLSKPVKISKKEKNVQSEKMKRSSEYYSVMVSADNAGSSKSQEHNDSAFNTNEENSREYEEDYRESEHGDSENEMEETYDEPDPLEISDSSDLDRSVLQNLTNVSNLTASLSEDVEKDKSKKLNPFNINVAKQLQRLESKVNKIAESLKDTRKIEATQCRRVLKESNVIQNNEELYLIGDTRFDADSMASILMAKTMRKRANLIVNHLWEAEETAKFVIRKTSNDSLLKQISSKQIKYVRDLCLHLQTKKQIQYAPGSSDDIGIYLKSWLSERFSECRRKLKSLQKAK